MLLSVDRLPVISIKGCDRKVNLKKETAAAVSFEEIKCYFFVARAFCSQSLPSTKRETM